MVLEVSRVRRKIASQPLAQLRASLRGQAILPEDPDYDATRMAWNLAVDQHPALIVIAQTADDIAEAGVSRKTMSPPALST